MSFKRLDPEDFLVSSDSIVNTLWSTDTPTLTTFFTSSTQVGSSAGTYYYSVYQTSSLESNAAVQFDIAYADSKGSGSVLYNNAVPELSPTKTIYGQYRSMILEDENSSFTFGQGTNVSQTIIGSQINLRATTVNTLFGSNTQLSATITFVGLDSGARLTIPITINKTTV